TSVDDFEAYRSWVLLNDDPAITSLPGYEWLCKFLVGGGQDVNYYKSWEKRRAELDLTNVRGLVVGFSASAIREPLTIDFEHASYRRSVARIVVRRVPAAPTLDGIIANDEWGMSDPAALTPVTVGSAEAATVVRAVYYHENLYIAF